MSEPKKNLSYKSYEKGDEIAILGLFEKSFGRPLPIEYWRWRFAENPAGPGVIFLAWEGPVLAAHYAVSRVNLQIADREVPTALSGTTMTHPDYRGLGLFPELARRTYDEMRRLGMALVWGFPNANSHRGFVQDLKWRDIAEIPTLRLTLSSKPLPDPSPNVSIIDRFDARFDSLWETVRAQFTVATRRDARFLSWRFQMNPSEKYKILGFTDGDRVRGYAVMKRYKNELQVTDLIAEHPDVMLQLAYGIAREMRTENAATAALWFPVSSPNHHVLEKVGFQNDGPVTYFGGLVLRDLDAATIYSSSAWLYGMGDSDVY